MRGIHVRVSQRPDASQRALSFLEEVVRLSSGLGGRDAARDIVGRERVRQTREGSLVSDSRFRVVALQAWQCRCGATDPFSG
jgi:hypothetical protein